MPAIVIGSWPVFLMVLPVGIVFAWPAHQQHEPEPIRIYHQTTGIAP